MKTYSIEWKRIGAVFMHDEKSHLVPTHMVAGYERCLKEFGYEKERT